MTTEIVKRAESFAKYHVEHASYGGASREFHERATSFIRSLAEENAALLARVEEAERARDEVVGRSTHQLVVSLRREVATLRAEIEMRDAALAEERAHADALARFVGLSSRGPHRSVGPLPCKAGPFVGETCTCRVSDARQLTALHAKRRGTR